MGEVRQRGCIWWIRYYRNGRRYEESSGSNKKGVARDLLKTREGDIVRGLPVTPKIGRLRFEEAVADVANDYRVNGRRTLSDLERRIVKHLNPFFGGRRMSAITTADVRAFIASRQDANASSAEINRELAIVKRAYRLAAKAGTLLYVPDVPMLRENNIRQGFFERDELEMVREELPEPLRPVVTFAYLTGWRTQSEILPLQWPQVDQRVKTIRLEPGTTKNTEGRTFPYGLLPELNVTIEKQWTEHERLKRDGVICPFVFQREGRPVRDFKGSWKKAVEAVGVPGKLRHDFRRTAVRNLVRAGVPEKMAMQLTGHKTRSVFDRYDIVNEADLRDAVGKLAAAGTRQSSKFGRVVKL